MKIQTILAAAALLIAAGGAQAQASSLVTNGSFEHGGVSENSGVLTHWNILNNIYGWTGGAKGIEIQPNGTVSGVSAFDGRQYVELDTTANSSMWQDLSTTVGNTYTLSFAYMPRPDNAGGKFSNKIEVLWDGGTLGTFSGTNTNGSWWEYERTDLTASFSSTTRLEFRAVGTSDSYGGFIDNVVVTAVPEPESYALLLAGLGLIGAIARRRGKPTLA